MTPENLNNKIVHNFIKNKYEKPQAKIFYFFVMEFLIN